MIAETLAPSPPRIFGAHIDLTGVFSQTDGFTTDDQYRYSLSVLKALMVHKPE